ncbi:uncharacterized protein BCR38DRAFT_364114 [Pseudomassariella vexata]|uniref:Zn(2)-C6 fungal-type domain-containing protein n=1 Tax=Pseudomassariella vexata TaxID=1141098 RepID=A0A1Y2E611_9PEZI|nr:uncharacterized protein BCR38DRAFT_364114 [Pseudomassariella vexata]ORY67000.1 hypothetical protein BCR38DRAFT_364114 [Pseudomassariella vexata]
MARKGSRKVRTGCYTCKIRKVKCDEKHPSCHRCTSTGRKCDGYVVVAATGLTFHRPSHLFQSIDQPGEGRALQFFHERVASFLSGPFDSYFWTHVVMQFSGFEPAVRHSIIAISTLYEDFNSGRGTTCLLRDNRLALGHYNAAIKKLRTVKNEPLVLLVCILFICIEYLQGNRTQVISHTRHGIDILQQIMAAYPWTKEYLAPIFRRLAVVPLFFGEEIHQFPEVPELDEPIPDHFSSFAEAQYFNDGLLNRTVRLIRFGDPYYRRGQLRRGPDELKASQAYLRESLDAWHTRFIGLQNKFHLCEDTDTGCCNLLLRYDVARIWTDLANDPDETKYDAYTPVFDSIVRRATRLAPVRIGDTTVKPSAVFSFEMGRLSMIYFVIMKCRHLPTRLEALALMRNYGIARETLWEVRQMYPVGRRIVEIEHDLVLDMDDQPCGENEEVEVDWEAMPPLKSRVLDFASSPNEKVMIGADGTVVKGMMASFMMRDDDGKVVRRTEFLPWGLGEE